MKIIESTQPFHHLIIDDFIPDKMFKKINNLLYGIDCDIPNVDEPYKRYSEWPACVPLRGGIGMEGDNIPWEGHDRCMNWLLNYIDSYFGFSFEDRNIDGSNKIELLKKYFNWKGYFEIARDSFPPHLDNAWRNLEIDKYYAGIIKGVIYFGKDDIDYTNYGTILLDNNTHSFETEVEFKPNRLILFDTSDTSLHATDYHGEMRNGAIDVRKFNNKINKLSHKRFSFNIEFLADENLEYDTVESIYNELNYPRAEILKWWKKFN